MFKPILKEKPAINLKFAIKVYRHVGDDGVFLKCQKHESNYHHCFVDFFCDATQYNSETTAGYAMYKSSFLRQGTNQIAIIVSQKV
jgi:hypothetical protein